MTMDWKKLTLVGALCAQSIAQASIWNDTEIPSNGLGHFSLKQTVDENTQDIMRSTNIPGLTLSITKNGRLIYSSGHGYAHWGTQWEMQPYHRVSIGSSSKVPVAMSMMHLLENNPFYTLDSKVYGNEGILDGIEYETSYTNGLQRHYPIIGMAITDLNRVVTWYSGNKYTVGTSSDLDAYRGPRDFTLPPGKTAKDVVDMAFGGNDGLFITYFRDKTFSVGKAFDLDFFFHSNSEITLASGQGTEHVLGISADTDQDLFYAYYDNGEVSSGNSISNLANRWTQSFQTEGDQGKRYRIRALARSDNGNTLAWYRNGKFSRGTVTNIGSITSGADYTRRNVNNSIRPWKKAYRNIAIKHLLSHTSGLVRSANREKTRAKYPSQLSQYNDDYLIPYEFSNRYVLSTSPLLFKPGEDSSYSNHGIGLVGHLIEEITGDNWYSYMRHNLLVPVGLTNIAPLGQYHNSAIDAFHHEIDGTNDAVSIMDVPEWPTAGSAAGSLRSSAQDLSALLVRTDQLSNYPDLLSSQSLQTMETRPFPLTASDRALGWKVTCVNSGFDPCYRKNLYHNGRTGYGTSYIGKYENFNLSKQGLNVEADNITVAVVANTRIEDTDQLKEIMELAAWAAAQESIPSTYDLFQVNPQ